MENRYDYIIIGGGLNGLGIAALLSNNRKIVLVLEKNNFLGGRLKISKIHDFILEEGLHFLKYAWKSGLNQILEELGYKKEKRLFIKPILNYFLFVGNELKSLDIDIKEIFIRKWFDKGWISVPKNMDEIRSHYYFNTWNLMHIFTKCFKIEYIKLCQKNLQELQKETNLNNIAYKYLLSAAGALLKFPYPDEVSAGEIIRHIKYSSKMPTLFGYPKNGWNSILNIFNQEIQKNGTIFTNCIVDKILFTEFVIDKRLKAIGVKTNLGEFYSENVIVATEPENIPNLFLKPNGDSYLNLDLLDFIKKIKSTAGITIYLGFNKKIYHGLSFIYIENPHIYGIFLSNLESNIVPLGKQLFGAFIPVKLNEIENEKIVEKYIETSIEKIFNLFPKFKDNLLFKQIYIHKKIDSIQPIPDFCKLKRPSIHIDNIENCYLIGDYINTSGSGGEIGYNSVLELYNYLKKAGKI